MPFDTTQVNLHSFILFNRFSSVHISLLPISFSSFHLSSPTHISLYHLSTCTNHNPLYSLLLLLLLPLSRYPLFFFLHWSILDWTARNMISFSEGGGGAREGRKGTFLTAPSNTFRLSSLLSLSLSLLVDSIPSFQ